MARRPWRASRDISRLIQSRRALAERTQAENEAARGQNLNPIPNNRNEFVVLNSPNYDVRAIRVGFRRQRVFAYDDNLYL